jgi:hypothetical protein
MPSCLFIHVQEIRPGFLKLSASSLTVPDAVIVSPIPARLSERIRALVLPSSKGEVIAMIFVVPEESITVPLYRAAPVYRTGFSSERVSDVRMIPARKKAAMRTIAVMRIRLRLMRKGRTRIMARRQAPVHAIG